MAIEEHDREDLLREGLMMPLRGETIIAGRTVIAGFRRGMQLSLYCGSDPVFQFNESKAVRRVYVDGQRIAAMGGRLVALASRSRGGKIQFEQITLDAERTDQITAAMTQWLDAVCQAAKSEGTVWRVIEQTPGQFRRQLLDWFQHAPSKVPIASQPNA